VIGLVFGLSIVITGIVLTVIIENVKNSLRRFRGKDASILIFG
jgi:chromate transport protein ChrA